MIHHDENLFYSRGAIVAETEWDICRSVVTNQLSNTSILVDFRHPLVKLLETASMWSLHMDDEVLRESSQHNDFYGFFTSADELLCEARQAKSKRGLHKIVSTVIETRYCVREYDERRYSDRARFRIIPNDWIIMDEANNRERVAMWHKTSFPDNLDLRPIFGPSREDHKIVIWDSRKSTDENRGLYRETLDMFVSMKAWTAAEADEKLNAYDENVFRAAS